MILVFGGTTEGKQVIEVLETLQLPYFYSSKTAINVELGTCGKSRFGAFSVEGLAQFISEKNITNIVHASHPFAEELHQTIDIVAEKCKIKVYRLERNYPKHTIDKNVHYVNNYKEALLLLNANYVGKTLLALTGVQTIVKLEKFWKNTLSYFRILNRQSSINIALINNFPESQLILGYPNSNVTSEIALFKQKNIEVVITKESGDSGALSIKIEAAKQCQIPIIIIKKPKLPTSFLLLNDKKELIEALNHTISTK